MFFANAKENSTSHHKGYFLFFLQPETGRFCNPNEENPSILSCLGSRKNVGHVKKACKDKEGGLENL